MTSDISDPLKSLEAERERLDGLLQLDDAWRALKQLEQRQAEGRPLSAVDAEGLRSRLESALRGNRVFLARIKLAEAITLLGGTDVAPLLHPSAVRAAAPTPQPPAPAMATIAPPEDAAASLKSQKDELVEPLSTVPAPTCDFTLIRGIDRALAERLSRHGVASFAEIAGWSHQDVQRISNELGLGRAISRQNWIEQAAMLAGATAVRSPVASPKQPIAVAATEPQARTLSAMVANAARAILNRGSRQRAESRSAELTTEPTLAPEVAELPLVERPAAEAPVRATQAPTEPALAAAPPADELTEIRGIDRSLALALQRAGVTGFAAIARWTASDAARITALLGPEARIAKDQWIEQAAVLAAGGETLFVRTRHMPLSLHVVTQPEAPVADAVFAARLRALSAASSSTAASGAMPASHLISDATDSAKPLPSPPPPAPVAPVEVPVFVTRALPVPVLPAPAVSSVTSPPSPPAPQVEPEPAPAMPSGFITLDDELSLSDMSMADIETATITTARIPDPTPAVARTSSPELREPQAPARVSAPATTLVQPPSPELNKPRTPVLPPPDSTTASTRPEAPAPAHPERPTARPAAIKFPDLPPLELTTRAGEHLATNTPAVDEDLGEDWPNGTDLDLPDLHFGEADVAIVSHPPLLDLDGERSDDEYDGRDSLRPFAASGGPGSLQSRLRSARSQRAIDATTYAAYRSEVEEASVEIVKRTDTSKTRKSDGTPDADPAQTRAGDVKTVRRFLKALTGQDK